MNPTPASNTRLQLGRRSFQGSAHVCVRAWRNDMDSEYIADDIEHVEHYLGGLFQLPVGVCIADTQDIVNDALGYEISDMHRQPDPDCVTAFQYAARIEWAPWSGSWRLIFALYRRECEQRATLPKPVEEVERRPLLEMPIDAQRRAHHYLAQLVAAAGGEWPLLRGMMSMTRRARQKQIG